jgi:hypothetical protein
LDKGGINLLETIILSVLAVVTGLGVTLTFFQRKFKAMAFQLLAFFVAGIFIQNFSKLYNMASSMTETQTIILMASFWGLAVCFITIDFMNVFRRK